MANSSNAMEQMGFQNLHLHWAEHKAAADQQAAQNQKPVDPKASITLAVDKLPGPEQAQMLSKIGIAANPANFDQMGPHEVTHEVKGVNSAGAEETVKTSLVGKTLN